MLLEATILASLLCTPLFRVRQRRQLFVPAWHVHLWGTPVIKHPKPRIDLILYVFVCITSKGPLRLTLGGGRIFVLEPVQGIPLILTAAYKLELTEWEQHNKWMQRRAQQRQG